MKIQAWILAVALALSFGSEGSAQASKGTRAGTAAVSSKGTKASPKPGARAVPESSLGSAERRRLLGGSASKAATKAAGKGKPTAKLEKPKRRS